MKVKKKNMMQLISDWCVRHGVESSTNGNHIIYTEEITEYFGVERKWLEKNIEEICCDYIDTHEEILDATVIEYDKKGKLEAINMMFCGRALCEKCGNMFTENCRHCEVAHPELWDEPRLQERFPWCRLDEIASKCIHALIEAEPIEAEIFFKGELDLTEEERDYFEIPTPTEIEDEDAYNCFDIDYWE